MGENTPQMSVVRVLGVLLRPPALALPDITGGAVRPEYDVYIMLAHGGYITIIYRHKSTIQKIRE